LLGLPGARIGPGIDEALHAVVEAYGLEYAAVVRISDDRSEFEVVYRHPTTASGVIDVGVPTPMTAMPYMTRQISRTWSAARWRSARRAMLDVQLAVHPIVLGNRLRIRQILLNMITNALKALESTPRSAARIEVRTEAVSVGRAVLVVEDNGPGLPPVVVESHGRRRLGLTLCRRLATVPSEWARLRHRGPSP
jgi:signal transduction histidine kinase